MIPFQIGRYQIIEELGRGAMAMVYKAKDQKVFGREVAVKVLSHKFLNDPDFRERFRREARIMIALDHAAVVQVHDFGEDKGRPFLVMRLMSGGSLKDRLAQGPLSVGEVAYLLASLAPALDYMHQRGIIHRDLKPSNILFDGHQIPNIADFGIAKLAEASLKLTNPDTLIGTPAYMSPEQIRGAPNLDGRSDIYSLGALLFHMLTGQRPYYNVKEPLAILHCHLYEPVPRVNELRSNLPNAYQEIIRRAMAKDPNDRYQSATALSNDFQALLTGRSPAIRLPNRRARLLKVLVGIAMCLFVIAISLLLLRPDQSTRVTQVSDKDGMNMLYVRGGEFLMGSENENSDAGDDEKPQRSVVIESFWIDQTTVTNGMYELCVQDGLCEVPRPTSSVKRENYYGNPEFTNYPVIYVNWEDARTYCNWAGRRLPTEAEWEKAARGTDGRIYPWGNEAAISDRVNFAPSDVGDTTSVGSYTVAASPYGALNMAGNVWEWVADWFDDQYYQNAPTRNPSGPTSGQFRVLRGGSWLDEARLIRASNRGKDAPSDRDVDRGFRCASSP